MAGHEDETQTVEPQTIEELAQANAGDLARRDDMMAKTFIALVHKNDPNLDEELTSGETNRQVGAETAYENWYNDQVYLYNRDKEAADRIAKYDAANPVVNDTIKEMMAAQLESQLTRLNGGNVLNDDAQAAIAGFMEGGAEAFGDSMRANRAVVAQGQSDRQAAIQAGTEDPNAQAFHGVMAVLMGDQSVWDQNRFQHIDTSDVELSPMQQAQATEVGIFTAMRDFVTGDVSGGGAETTLARLNGVEWGAFDRDTMTYEGINPINGLGHQPDFAEAMARFADTDAPVGTYRLNDTSPEVPANIDGLFTQAMEGRTVSGLPMLELSTDEARADWNTHLAGGLALKLSGNALQERMKDFAVAYGDEITLASEVIEVQARVAAEQDAAARAAAEAEAARLQAIATASSQAQSEAEAQSQALTQAAAEVDDPLSATAVDYYSADEGLGPLIQAEREVTITEFESVPGFQAAMEAHQNNQPIPDFSPLAQLVQEPELGPRIQQ